MPWGCRGGPRPTGSGSAPSTRIGGLSPPGRARAVSHGPRCVLLGPGVPGGVRENGEHVLRERGRPQKRYCVGPPCPEDSLPFAETEMSGGNAGVPMLRAGQDVSRDDRPSRRSVIVEACGSLHPSDGVGVEVIPSDMPVLSDDNGNVTGQEDTFLSWLERWSSLSGEEGAGPGERSAARESGGQEGCRGPEGCLAVQ
jgi:hypothetical protein